MSEMPHVSLVELSAYDMDDSTVHVSPTDNQNLQQIGNRKHDSLCVRSMQTNPMAYKALGNTAVCMEYIHEPSNDDSVTMRDDLFSAQTVKLVYRCRPSALYLSHYNALTPKPLLLPLLPPVNFAKCSG